MKFKINRTQRKDETTYKSLYIKQSLADAVEKIARENNTSWNNVVISMIESCLEDEPS
ncbi:MAG: hypothetical protein Q4C72_03675 [Eubacteriales bacterium]|nr:hypothetical protein [Eubacteriales bacterium]